MPNRKLIRPSLSDFKARSAAAPSRTRPAPPEQTGAEAFYYTKQMAARTPMVVILLDGEILRGMIEWYDRDCLKVNRPDGPNLLVLKHAIKYMYKEDEKREVSEAASAETA
ncbi:MAG TPA: hypothetical protein VJV23_03310 [Candidatus Polarisedimenticolia bacterium]|nr:hypothetical protein [Candidatus Polarisedimenticolia bacterium]